MRRRSVTLQEERYADSAYNLRAHVLDDGTLEIEGHDLGATPKRVWGVTEYEWVITVPDHALPQLIAALDGDPEVDDALELLSVRFREDERYASRSFLQDQGIPHEFWSRVGD